MSTFDVITMAFHDLITMIIFHHSCVVYKVTSHFLYLNSVYFAQMTIVTSKL